MPFGSHHRRSGGTHHHPQPASKAKATRPSAVDRQLWDFIIVVDFEATCEENVDDYPHEIIEFPAVVINVKDGRIEKNKSFRTFVKPLLNPKLSHFCTALTGITQAQVDSAPTLKEAVAQFDAWYRRTIPLGATAVVATDGPTDLRDFMLEFAARRDGVSFPSFFYEYLDVRETYARYFNKGVQKSLMKMLGEQGIKFEGRHHSGIDDAVNIARLMIAMMRKGCKFYFLVALPLHDKLHYDMDVCPKYRLKSGSGLLDKTHVDDIAKAAFGDAFFNYGSESLPSQPSSPTSASEVPKSFVDMPIQSSPAIWKVVLVSIVMAYLLQLLLSALWK